MGMILMLFLQILYTLLVNSKVEGKMENVPSRGAFLQNFIDFAQELATRPSARKEITSRHHKDNHKPVNEKMVPDFTIRRGLALIPFQSQHPNMGGYSPYYNSEPVSPWQNRINVRQDRIWTLPMQGFPQNLPYAAMGNSLRPLPLYQNNFSPLQNLWQLEQTLENELFPFTELQNRRPQEFVVSQPVYVNDANHLGNQEDPYNPHLHQSMNAYGSENSEPNLPIDIPKYGAEVPNLQARQPTGGINYGNQVSRHQQRRPMGEYSYGSQAPSHQQRRPAEENNSRPQALNQPPSLNGNRYEPRPPQNQYLTNPSSSNGLHQNSVHSQGERVVSPQHNRGVSHQKNGGGLPYHNGQTPKPNNNLNAPRTAPVYAPERNELNVPIQHTMPKNLPNSFGNDSPPSGYPNFQNTRSPEMNRAQNNIPYSQQQPFHSFNQNINSIK